MVLFRQAFFDKRISAEVPGDSLGDEWKVSFSSWVDGENESWRRRISGGSCCLCEL